MQTDQEECGSGIYTIESGGGDDDDGGCDDDVGENGGRML
jgi:hypothetical protein